MKLVRTDDRIMFPLSHGVTQMFLFALDTIMKNLYFDLEELWFETGLSTSKTFEPVHEAVDILE